MTAYNYEAQQWTSGTEARRVRREQCLEELEILRSKDGDRYAAFSGIEDKEAAIARLEMEVAGLDNLL